MTSTQRGPVCIIVSRNLGDAVIQSGFVRQLGEAGPWQRLIIWTRPQVKFLFDEIPGCEIVTSPFPVGTSKGFDRPGFTQFVAAVRQLRRAKIDTSLDFIGDVRERFFGRLSGSSKHLHIGWADGHPFGRIIRNPIGRGRPVYEVPPSVPNIYEAYARFTQAVLSGAGAPTGAAPASSAAPKNQSRTWSVGLHPFASQLHKQWPAERWAQLATQLSNAGAQVTAFGSPAEAAQLRQMFGGLAQQPRYFTGSLAAFADEVRRLDLMIGLDSFSVHMAHRQGVRTIMINACNHPQLWTPPGAAMISSAGGCPAYPCMNVPSCEKGPEPHRCIRSVAVNDVLQFCR